MEIAYKISKPFKGLFGGLGWTFIISGDRKTAPPPTCIAASIVLLFNSVGIVFGAIVLVARIVNFLIPSFAVDALLAKNAIYFLNMFLSMPKSIWPSKPSMNWSQSTPESLGKRHVCSRSHGLPW
ncbi:MAG TPA: hypothetical protein DEA75_18845 [Rhodobacteraceae bacterium]|nr:hypothetical protein [Paracoccaceae bacterium]